MKRKTLLASIIALGMGSGAALADEKSDATSADISSSSASMVKFSSVDTDNDGWLSTQEASMAMPEIEFEDDNQDGYVNLDEAENAIADLDFDHKEIEADLDVLDVEADANRREGVTVNVDGDREYEESDYELDDDVAIVGEREFMEIVKVVGAEKIKTRG